MSLRDFIYGLPKAELHLHLEGTLEPELKLELAKKNNVEIGMSTVEEIKSTYQFNDLPSFLDVYYSGMSVLQTEDDFYQLADQYLAKAKTEGVKHVEMFFDPQAHTSRGVSFDDVINGYYRASQESEARHGITSSLILCFLRDMSEESALEHFDLAMNHRDKIIGFGLDSDEHDNPPTKFERVFAKAKAEGFKITMHCDIDQKDSIQHINDVIHVINVDRIDHGTNIVESPELVDYVIENNIGLTSCPISNGFINEVTEMKSKEIKYLLDKGVKIMINSDDPAYFGGYVAENMCALADKYDFSKEDIIKLAKNSFEISWISPEEKAAYIKSIDEYVANN